ncbi:MAG: cupin domain-containing protein [Bacteroidota bacterium]
MKRRKFIKTTLAGTPMLATPALVGSHVHVRKGFKIPAGEGRIHGHIQLKGVNVNILDLKVGGTDTGGQLAIFEQTSLSPKRGTPLHMHYNQDEIFYVLQGEYRFQVGDEKYSLATGDSIFLPRQVPHSWVQVSESGKMTVTFQPAGKMEAFFVTLAALPMAPTPEEMARLFEAHEMKIMGPPVSLD